MTAFGRKTNTSTSLFSRSDPFGHLPGFETSLGVEAVPDEPMEAMSMLGVLATLLCGDFMLNQSTSSRLSSGSLYPMQYGSYYVLNGLKLCFPRWKGAKAPLNVQGASGIHLVDNKDVLKIQD